MNRRKQKEGKSTENMMVINPKLFQDDEHEITETFQNRISNIHPH